MKKIEKIERATQREEARAGHASGVNEPLEAALAEGATSGLSGAQSRISSAIRRRDLAIAAKDPGRTPVTGTPQWPPCAIAEAKWQPPRHVSNLRLAAIRKSSWTCSPDDVTPVIADLCSTGIEPQAQPRLHTWRHDGSRSD